MPVDSMPIKYTFLSCLVALAFSCGCQKQEQIQTYYVESAEPANQSAEPVMQVPTPPAVPPTADRGEPTHRMVAAVIRCDQQAWFVKAVAEIEQIKQVEKELLAFLESITLDANEPKWDLPEGWSTGPEKPMRLATLLIPQDESNKQDGKKVEISVIGLPLTGDWQAQILSNINRWRGQLGREPITAGLLSEMAKPMSVSDGSVLFDATGWFSDGGMSGAPFAKMAPSPSKPAPQAPNSMTGSVPVGKGELKETPPKDWKVLAGSSMRKASYTSGNGATVTAFVFPTTAPMMADPLTNINRWRGEVGLPPTTADDLVKETQSITLSGIDSVYIELLGEKESTLAAMSVRDDQAWFFKLRGPNDAVEADREAFKQWLSTVQF